MKKIKALCSELRTQLDVHKGIRVVEIFELLELILSNLSEPKTFNINIDTLVKEVNMDMLDTLKGKKRLSMIIKDGLINALKGASSLLKKNKIYTEDDMISFATHVYNKIADLPGHESDIDQLKEWEE